MIVPTDDMIQTTKSPQAALKGLLVTSTQSELIE